ncbi:MAG: response regulator, partial [Desulfobacterales bacterium]|nr:response regulator [Desulfobacterales bacterium]
MEKYGSRIELKETILKEPILLSGFQRWYETVKVFIVEDNLATQYLYQEVLTAHGYEIAGIANDGEEAVNMFKSFSEKPKIILMDHRMPNKNGIEAMQEILQIEKTTKIILASADEIVKKEALAIGAWSFIDKPFDKEYIKQFSDGTPVIDFIRDAYYGGRCEAFKRGINIEKRIY